MCRLLSVVLAAMLVSTATVRAGDFTGVYVGVNGGYAHGRDTSREIGGSRLPIPAPNVETGLPPSALNAAGRLDERRSGSRRDGSR